MGFCNVCLSAGSVNKYGFCEICGTEHVQDDERLLAGLVAALDAEDTYGIMNAVRGG